MGDFFHDRKSINSNTLWVANEFLENLSDIDIYMIIGNHDTYLKNSTKPHSLRSFDKFEHVHIVENCYKLNKLITLVSWNKDFRAFDTPYLCGHFDIAGCEISSNFTESKETLKISDFSKYKEVFSGHFHTPNKTKNISYIGSVMPFTFADVDSKRGYYILNIDDNNISKIFIEFTKCPKYIILDINDDIDNIDDDYINGNIVKLAYDHELSSVDNELLINKIWQKKPLFVHSDFKNMTSDDTEETRTDVQFKNTKEILFEYLDKVKIPEHIKKKNLKALINELLETER